MPTSPPRTVRRADAELNAGRILDAAAEVLRRSPTASMAEIAQVAGLGRVTVYAHYPSRESLIEATLSRLLERGESVLSQVDLTVDPKQALVALVEASWQLTADAGAVLEAAQNALPTDRVQQLHAVPALRVESLLRRGQDAGVFRTDLPLSWLVAVLHGVINSAAAEVRQGRMDVAAAGPTIVSTVLAAFTPPSPR
jgi:TetR/AcrR family transcriptional repressor of mexCD-oprJ operon